MIDFRVLERLYQLEWGILECVEKRAYNRIIKAERTKDIVF